MRCFPRNRSRARPEVIARLAKRAARTSTASGCSPLKVRDSNARRSGSASCTVRRLGDATGGSFPRPRQSFGISHREIEADSRNDAARYTPSNEGRMVACTVAIPDLNQALKGTGGRLLPYRIVKPAGAGRRYIDQLRLLLLGDRSTAYRALGLYPLLIFALHEQTRRRDTVQAGAVSRGCSKRTATSTSRPTGRGSPIQDLSHLPEGARRESDASQSPDPSRFIGRHVTSDQLAFGYSIGRVTRPRFTAPAAVLVRAPL